MSAGLSNIVFIAVLVGVFYFLVIRPQQKRTRDQRNMLSALKPGDEIVTIGGIYGTVTDVSERITVKVLGGAELELARQAVAQVVARSSDSAEETPAVESDLAGADDGTGDDAAE